MSFGVRDMEVSFPPGSSDFTADSMERRMSAGFIWTNAPRYELSLIPSKAMSVRPVALPSSASFTVVFTVSMLSSAEATGEVISVSPSGVATR